MNHLLTAGLQQWSARAALLIILHLSVSAASADEPVAHVFDIGHAQLNTLVWGDNGERETIIALPGSGGDVTRYRDIGPALAAAGYRMIAVNQRGIMGSTGSLENLTLHDYAADVVAIIDSLGIPKAHLIGWALGNRTSRVVATDFPDRVASITLIAAGGLAEPLTEPGELGELLGNAALPVAEKVRLARRTLFSDATPDSVIEEFVSTLQYWNAARASQTRANRDTPLQEWWAGGNGPMLIVQGLDDKTAPPANGIQMQAEFGDRITLVNLENAGHLMGMEQPQATAAAIIEFLHKHPVQ
ncbi:MAG: alpha/beta hydrolase [Gammaproteobacteria bacterium]|nr:alpha/beta hydrolase [Gammaproteobacteria bacterium]